MNVIEVLPPSGDHLVDLWEEEVAARYIRSDSSRADADWDWRILYGIFASQLLDAEGQGIRRWRPRMFQLQREGRPVAMVALLQYAKWIEGDANGVYVWHLSAAPATYLSRTFETNIPVGVGKAAVKVAAMLALLDSKTEGRLWLDTALLNREFLLAWYAAVGMTRILPGAIPQLPALFDAESWRNDGSYLCYTTDTCRWAVEHLEKTAELTI